MNAVLLALVSLLQAAPARAGSDGARPAECGAADGRRAANAWERAKEPNLRRYCDLVASGTAKLVGSGSVGLVQEVPRIADEADALLPGRAAPSVLRGRAYLRLGRPEDAVAALASAVRRDERALDDPVALLAWARANARTGRLADAVTAYRAALPRTSTLSAQERAAASFEAGMTVMAQGPKGIDDAVAMLRQARRDAPDAMRAASTVALALALDRAAQRDEAKALLAERAYADAARLFAEPRVAEALADAGVPHETHALVALALSSTHPKPSKDAWRTYLEGPGGRGPWAEHARVLAGGAAPKEGGAR